MSNQDLEGLTTFPRGLGTVTDLVSANKGTQCQSPL